MRRLLLALQCHGATLCRKASSGDTLDSLSELSFGQGDEGISTAHRLSLPCLHTLCGG